MTRRELAGLRGLLTSLRRLGGDAPGLARHLAAGTAPPPALVARVRAERDQRSRGGR